MTLKELLSLVFEEFNLVIPSNTKGITKSVLINFISADKPSKNAFGYSAAGWDKFISKVFPDKKSSVYKQCTYRTYCLALLELKYCPKCEEVLDFSEFHSNKSRSDSLSSQCKSCDRVTQRIIGRNRQANRRTAKLSRTPLWYEYKEIREFYRKCPAGYHVDHIIPPTRYSSKWITRSKKSTVFTCKR